MIFHIENEFRPLLESVDFSAEGVFANPAIRPWRVLPDRENCSWDFRAPDGRAIRFHVKRHPASAAGLAMAEVSGLELLRARGIPAARLVAFGRLEDDRSFIITEDLAGFTPADKLVHSGFPFERLLNPTAELAAQLHRANLHHRDLYLCHFMVRPGNETAEVRLIDAARVRVIPRLTRRRWIVKDLSQFWYSTLSLPITDDQRGRWLRCYATQTGEKRMAALQRSIESKSARIAVHDRKLRRRQPGRNISIPQ